MAKAAQTGPERFVPGPDGAKFHRNAAPKSLQETAAAAGFAFVLALVAIYMILASQFNSFVHPFPIMISALLSFMGDCGSCGADARERLSSLAAPPERAAPAAGSLSAPHFRSPPARFARSPGRRVGRGS